MKIKRSLLKKLIKEALKKSDVSDFTRDGISDRERRKAYILLARKFHPDRNKAEDATADFQKIEQIKQALEDGTYQESAFFPEERQASSTGEPIVDRFVRYFNSFNPGNLSNIFSTVDNVSFLNIYGYYLLRRYSNEPSQALKLYQRAETLLNNQDSNFELNEISGLGYNEDYVRWKFKSMVYASKASDIPLINLGDILSHVEYTIYEFAKILQRTEYPDIREGKNYLDALRNQISKYHNEMDQRERAMNAIHMHRICIGWIEAIERLYSPALTQYSLMAKTIDSLEYHMFTYYGAKPPR